ncbi:alpha/beta-hydrolase [Mollisia scopiformis]|uniref:Alpha/beta-hydrolase n=1 Tax=Mollisia scopiformis TaxID=149040 RepID=A0A132B2L9_MOLSC|nr:alpha/beta-hydrolase [Mollisia scopiformis]KUJ06636.1 alpha/beta-hydrolase [Mollisia scopiformis]
MRVQFINIVLVAVRIVNAVDPLVDLTYTKYQGLTLQNGVNQWLALRYAAPPTGSRRFAAPQPPLTQNSTQDATKEGALCVSANNPEGLQYGSARQPMAEDCLFLAVYSPLNATEDSKLPIMFFIQGGGFTSDSNGNFNGIGLVEASGMNMMVVRINYRVGMLGFIGGSVVNADTKGAVPNNGLNDMIAAARWVKQYATKFGGDPNHIVMSGDSAGANAIDILLTANNGAGFPDLFVGAAAESTGWGGDPYAVDRDAEFAKNVNSTGCSNSPDPLDCMRLMPIDEFQNKTTSDGWGPTIDWKLLMAPHYEMMEQGKFQKIPVIYGSTNEGTPDFISNQSATTDADIEKHIRDAVGPAITDAQVQSMLIAYPASLNNVSFFGRDVSVKNETLRKGKGPQWQRDAAIMTELKLQCVAAFFSDMFAASGMAQNYQYRYNVLDTTPGGLADQGIFTPHTSELYAIWGRNNTDGNDPKCFKIDSANGGCASAISIVQSYWISFVRTLDPNTFRLAGTPTWEAWTIESPRRIVFNNANASIETMGAGVGEVVIAGMNQRQRCNTLTLPLAKVANAGLKAGETLQPFANGTRADPTLGDASLNVTAASSKMSNLTGTASSPKFTGAASSSGLWMNEFLALSIAAIVSALLLM